MTLWFYSDPHFGQASMVNGTFTHDGKKVRPFTSVEEMDETMIENHNRLVKPQDHVYCLGDFAMRKEDVARVAPRLNGHKRLILGNHDIYPVSFYQECGFKKIMAYRVFAGMIFSHIPIAAWSQKYQANIHGHCHLGKPLFYEMANPDREGFQRGVRYVNLSVERTHYLPVSLEQIAQWIPSGGK
jgi:calcineurin-like phosphoesterase family protein